jgi:hypothetical protein
MWPVHFEEAHRGRCTACFLLDLPRALCSGCRDRDAIVNRSSLVSVVVKGHLGSVSPSVHIICQKGRYV